MRNNTPDRARLNRQVKAGRRSFLEKFTSCWHCGRGPTVCDEMVSGMSDRKKGIQHRECWTALCSDCNEHVLNGSAPWVLITKLALKWIYDRPFFDRVLVNTLRGREPDAITMAEIVPTICRRLDGGRA